MDCQLTPQRGLLFLNRHDMPRRLGSVDKSWSGLTEVDFARIWICLESLSDTWAGEVSLGKPLGAS
jgi:hypothetical protein